MLKLTKDDVEMLATRRPAARLHYALVLAETSYAEVARRIGLSRSHLAGSSQGRQTLSLTMKVRVARVLGVPASVIWPELATLARELLEGPQGGGK